LRGWQQVARMPLLKPRLRKSSGHFGSLEMSSIIARCFVKAALPHEPLLGPIRHGVMAALKVAGTRGPAQGDSHSPSTKQIIEVTRGAWASIATHKSFRTSERLMPLAIISSIRVSLARTNSIGFRSSISVAVPYHLTT